MTIASFLFFLIVVVLIGISSSIHQQRTNKDYLLANQDVSAWLVGLSAVATNNSGYMFIGLIGFTYTVGLQVVWLMVGWILGDLMISQITHSRIRLMTEQNRALSFGTMISNWQGHEMPYLRRLAGLVTLLFLGTYAAAQFKAGSKALHVLFGWDFSVGAIIGAIIVFLYSLAGGIRATIWTDAAQSFIMLFSMALILCTSVYLFGGIDQTLASLYVVSDTYMSLKPSDLLLDNTYGIALFVLGWFFAGFGIIGQPHIMSRFMALNDNKNMNKARCYYYVWYTVFFAITICVGLVTRLLLADPSSMDAELALPIISMEILPDALVGFVLAGIFAATMSTADSQILSCTAAISRDLFNSNNQSLSKSKLATAFVTIVALTIALFGSENVFGLVLIAWSVLGAAFAPLLLLLSIGKKISEPRAIFMVIAGVATTIVWRHLGLGAAFYEIAPGMIAGFVAYSITCFRVKRGS